MTGAAPKECVAEKVTLAMDAMEALVVRMGIVVFSNQVHYNLSQYVYCRLLFDSTLCYTSK